MQSHVKARTESGVLVLTILEKRLAGEALCVATRDELLLAVEQGVSKVVVDFQLVEYVSSVAFRTLLGLRRRVLEVGGRLVLCNLSPLVSEVFEASRLLINTHSPDSLFMQQPNVPAAIAFLN